MRSDFRAGRGSLWQHRAERRQLLLGGGLSAALVGCGLMLPQVLWAMNGEISFNDVSIADALRSMGAIQADPAQLVLKIPEVAEDGALVPVSVECLLPGAQDIFIVVDVNPDPLAAHFNVPAGTEPFVATRIKMAGDGIVYAVVRTEGRIYSTSKAMKVTVGGCG